HKRRLSCARPPLVARSRPPDRAALLPAGARPKQLGGLSAARARLDVAAGWDNPPFLGDDPPAEVRAVEPDSPDRLVDGPKLGQGEGPADERRRFTGQVEVAPHPFDRVPHDPGVVKCE